MRKTPVPYYVWSASHNTKRVYRHHWQAWLTIIRLWITEGWGADGLAPYKCLWADRLEDGETAVPHFHIGHNRYAWTLRETLRYRLRRHLIWPYRRARRRVRQLFTR